MSCCSQLKAPAAQLKPATSSCSAGVWESWRADAAAFPDAVLGPEAGPKQRYVDIRKQEVRAIMLQVGPCMVSPHAAILTAATITPRHTNARTWWWIGSCLIPLTTVLGPGYIRRDVGSMASAFT